MPHLQAAAWDSRASPKIEEINVVLITPQLITLILCRLWCAGNIPHGLPTMFTWVRYSLGTNGRINPVTMSIESVAGSTVFCLPQRRAILHQLWAYHQPQNVSQLWEKMRKVDGKMDRDILSVGRWWLLFWICTSRRRAQQWWCGCQNLFAHVIEHTQAGSRRGHLKDEVSGLEETVVASKRLRPLCPCLPSNRVYITLKDSVL